MLGIKLDRTGLENPNKWETCMLLNDNLANKSNNCLFLNAMVTVEQYRPKNKEGFHYILLHQHTEKD